MENFYYYHAVKNSSCVLSFGDCMWWKLLISSEVYQQCHMKTIRTPNLSSKQERHKLMLKQLDLKKKLRSLLRKHCSQLKSPDSSLVLLILKRCKNTAWLCNNSC